MACRHERDAQHAGRDRGPVGVTDTRVASSKTTTAPGAECRFCSPLSQEARAEYYECAKPLAGLMGVKRSILPAAYGEFRLYYQDMLGRLVVGSMAHEIAAAIFAAKLGPVPVSPVGPVIAAALLPDDRVREAYRLKWGWREQVIWRAFRVAAGAAARVTPPQVNEWPHARVARQRCAAAVTTGGAAGALPPRAPHLQPFARPRSRGGQPVA